MTSQTSIPRKVISLATGSCVAHLADARDGVGDHAVQRPGEAVGDPVELGEVDAAGPRHQPAAHGSLDSFQQRHEARVRVPAVRMLSGGAQSVCRVAAKPGNR